MGEGTYGEAFKAGNTVCKIVPVDGALRVNGEVQKVFTNNYVPAFSLLLFNFFTNIYIHT